ncbi:MAG: NADH-quinone oxidoreductase subunit I [Acidobacteriota bacterium]
MKVHRHELKWWEELYLFQVLRGMLQTIKHFFSNALRWRTRFTVEYPDVRWPLPPGYRGAPVLVTGDDGHERCVACLMCQFACPPQAIYIEAEETDLDKERRPKVFDIDFGRCIFCGYCEEACPEIAIVLKDEFELAQTRREDLIFPKEKLLQMGLKEREAFVYPIEERGPVPPRERGRS